MKVLLLAAIFGVLLWMALHPRPQVGRFIEAGGGDSALQGLLLDMATGQICYTPMVGQKPISTLGPGEIRNCSDLR
jgi:hypothetical protein